MRNNINLTSTKDTNIDMLRVAIDTNMLVAVLGRLVCSDVTDPFMAIGRICVRKVKIQNSNKMVAVVRSAILAIPSLMTLDF